MKPCGERWLSKGDMESYEFDCEGLARRELKGKNIEDKITRWAEDHMVTPEEMRARIDAIKARWRPYAVRTLNWLKSEKAKGKTEVYKFDLGGKLPVDEAIRRQEEKLARF